MPKAFVLLSFLSGGRDEDLYALKDIEGIKSVTRVTGVFDFIVEVEHDSPQGLGNLITTHLDTIPGLYSRQTAVDRNSLLSTGEGSTSKNERV